MLFRRWYYAQTMKCPHCLINFHDAQTICSAYMGDDPKGHWRITRRQCSACRRFIFNLDVGALAQSISFGGQNPAMKISQSDRVWPKGISRIPCPKEVPPAIAEDYTEACLVLNDSAKASAALSRRCLQNVLREAAKVKPGDLSNEIQEVLDSGKLRGDIADALDMVRAIGNFGAHPIKSRQTGEIIQVEPGEAEWNLDVLESLFDFYYVQPAIIKAKKDALNKKLQEAGKPPVK